MIAPKHISQAAGTLMIAGLIGYGVHAWRAVEVPEGSFDWHRPPLEKKTDDGKPPEPPDSPTVLHQHDTYYLMRRPDRMEIAIFALVGAASVLCLAAPNKIASIFLRFQRSTAK